MTIKARFGLVKATVVALTIGVSLVLSVQASFAQQMADDQTAAPAAAPGPAAPSTGAQITPSGSPAATQSQMRGDPFDFAPASAAPSYTLGLEPCGVSGACPVLWHLDAGWLIDNGGPAMFLSRLGEDD